MSFPFIGSPIARPYIYYIYEIFIYIYIIYIIYIYIHYTGMSPSKDESCPHPIVAYRGWKLSSGDLTNTQKWCQESLTFGEEFQQSLDHVHFPPMLRPGFALRDLELWKSWTNRWFIDSIIYCLLMANWSQAVMCKKNISSGKSMTPVSRRLRLVQGASWPWVLNSSGAWRAWSWLKAWDETSTAGPWSKKWEYINTGWWFGTFVP